MVTAREPAEKGVRTESGIPLAVVQGCPCLAVHYDRAGYIRLYNASGQERAFHEKAAEGAMRADSSGMNAQAKGLATARG